ncbi:MAG: YceI family protein [Candidatus Hydrogenedentota bacterium]
MKSLLHSLIALAVFVGAADAAYYDIGKNGENKVNVSWESNASLEMMVGRTNKATGFVYFDDAGKSHALLVTIPVRSMKTGIDARDEHMIGPDWLDAEKYPNIEFKSVAVKNKSGKPDQYEITGDMTIHGKTRRITVTGSARRFPARPTLEKMGYVGDIIQLKTSFKIKLSDFGVIVPERLLGLKMADELSISFDIFAFTNNDPGRKPEMPSTRPAVAAPPASQPAR